MPRKSISKQPRASVSPKQLEFPSDTEKGSALSSVKVIQQVLFDTKITIEIDIQALGPLEIPGSVGPGKPPTPPAPAPHKLSEIIIKFDSSRDTSIDIIGKIKDPK
jgi:hypothetical protein